MSDYGDALRAEARIAGVPCSKCGQRVRYDDFHFDCPALSRAAVASMPGPADEMTAIRLTHFFAWLVLGMRFGHLGALAEATRIARLPCP